MWVVLICIFLLPGPTWADESKKASLADEMGAGAQPSSKLLFVEPDTIAKERAEFVTKLKQTGKAGRRQLYEAYLDVIGANGILDGIESVQPRCHSVAHHLGKIIFARLGDIGPSLRVCGGRCTSGCMHGVLMETFAGVQSPHAHLELDTLKPVVNELCRNNSEMMAAYAPGDCAHGVGHAFMFLSHYSIPDALAVCSAFEAQPMVYYCATGAYMEYVEIHARKEAKTKSLFYPCDTYAYPAACSRHKMPFVMTRYYAAKKPTTALIDACRQLSGKFRLGCFHGLGSAHVDTIEKGQMRLAEVCLQGTPDEAVMCIEGAMERMGRRDPARGREICEELDEELDGSPKQTCLTAVAHGVYDLDKDFTLYVAE